MREVEISVMLIRVRRSRMWTQGRLAEEAGVSPTTVSGIESGRIQRPHFGTIRKLTEALGVSPEQLTSPVEVAAEGQRRTSPPLSLGWSKTVGEEEFEREVEDASLESLGALRRELEEERERLQRSYGEARGRKQREIKRRIRNVAAQSVSVDTSIMFHQDERNRSVRDGET